MSYTALCEVKDIQAYFVNKKFTSETVPTVAQIDDWINEATAIILSAVSEQYVVPITDENDLLILKNICVAYVRDNVNYLLGSNRITVPGKAGNVPRQMSHKNFWDKISMLKEGTIKLLGSDAAPSGVYAMSYNVEEDIESEAQKGVDQW